MIHNETNLEVADNSGARRVQCIKVLGGSKRKFASVGDIIIVSIKEAIRTNRNKNIWSGNERTKSQEIYENYLSCT